MKQTQRSKSSANALNNSIQTMKILLNKNEKHVLNVNDSISWNRKKERKKKRKVYSREKVHRYYLVSGKIQIPKHN